MNINGRKKRVFFFLLGSCADIPAHNVGFFFMNTTNRTRICRCCFCVMKHVQYKKEGKKKASKLQFVEPFQEGSERIRTREEMKKYHVENGRKTGIPEDVLLQKEMIDEHGMAGISEKLLWPNDGDMHCLLVDVMHALCIGLTPKFFLLIVDKLVAAKAQDKFWHDLGILWKRHMTINKLDLGSFYDRATFNVYMTAAANKSFVPFSVHALMQLKLIPESLPARAGLAAKEDHQLKIECVHHWILYSRMHELIFAHSFTNLDLDELEQLKVSVLLFWKKQFQELLTINAHSIEHIIMMKKKYGPIRLWSNFLRESILGSFKRSSARNTNYSKMEVTGMKRILVTKLWQTYLNNTNKVPSYRRYV
jgi:hypothetical protein